MATVARARVPARFAVTASVVAFVAALVLGVVVGAEPVSLTRALAEDGFDRAVVLVRLPRVVLGAVAGAGLSTVGVALQASLRNPLAEPYVLGVSGGAALGATVAIVLGLSQLSWLGASLLPLAALTGGLLAVLVVQALSRGRGHEGKATVLLVGVVVNAFASALITLLKTTVSAEKSQALLFWLVGFLDATSRPEAIAFVTLYTAFGCLVLFRDAPSLNLLALGDDTAESLGVDTRALSRRALFASSLVVGAVVSVTGLIGFVGLVVPHALRRALGPDVKVLVPTAFFGGAAFLVLCDMAARIAFRALGTTPPVGAITALVGGPLLVWLLRRRG